jgi:alpha-amylase
MRMHPSGLLSICLVLVAPHVHAANPVQWRERSIYQLLTDRFALSNGDTTAPCNVEKGRYCGGTWAGIEEKLDYIQGMGFDAIWISPITQNIERSTDYGEAYHGYWQQDIYSINTHFGTPEDLKALAGALHIRGMVR